MSFLLLFDRPNHQACFDPVSRLLTDYGVGLIHSIGRMDDLRQEIDRLGVGQSSPLNELGHLKIAGETTLDRPEKTRTCPLVAREPQGVGKRRLLLTTELEHVG